MGIFQKVNLGYNNPDPSRAERAPPPTAKRAGVSDHLPRDVSNEVLSRIEGSNHVAKIKQVF